jgi:hypothetical protein
MFTFPIERGGRLAQTLDWDGGGPSGLMVSGARRKIRLEAKLADLALPLKGLTHWQMLWVACVFAIDMAS